MWLLGTCDRLIGTVFAACTGVAASQMQAFIAAYLQRLGGHLDEARRSLAKMQAGEFLPGADAASQERLVTAFARRVDELLTAHNAIASSDIFSRPIAFFAHMDRTIADATLMAFTPALPLDSASIVYALVGMVLGWMLYELVKLPLRLLTGRRRRYG